jgi:hypothetical protein
MHHNEPGTLMKKIALLLAIFVSAYAEAGNTDEALTVTMLGQSNFTISCQSTTGNCYYLITKSMCNEEFVTTGQKKRTCHISRFLDFKVASGETKTVTNLPGDFQYCMSVSGSPTVATCAASPTPH